MSPTSRNSLIMSAGSVGAALAFGVSLHFLAVYLRDHGPSGQGQSLPIALFPGLFSFGGF